MSWRDVMLMNWMKKRKTENYAKDNTKQINEATQCVYALNSYSFNIVKTEKFSLVSASCSRKEIDFLCTFLFE